MLHPREDCENLGKMVCFHKRYRLGDSGNPIDPSWFNSWREMEEYIDRKLNAMVILPVYMYDHSGITISTKPYDCPWDSGQLGFIYATRDDIVKWFERKRWSKTLYELTEKILEQEVEEYDRYLQGGDNEDEDWIC